MIVPLFCKKIRILKKCNFLHFYFRFKWENIEKGCSNIFNLSLKYLDTYTQLRGSQVVKLKRGYCDVFDALINKNKEKFYSKLKLENCLEKILLCRKLVDASESETTGQQECLHCRFSQDPNKPVVLVRDLKNKQDVVIICNQAICTMSLGYLKEHFETLIEPFEFVPSEKLNSIRKLGFGPWNKVFYQV